MMKRTDSLVSTIGLNKRPKTAEELEDVIPWGVWKATFLICTQSFTYGYVLSSLNSTLQFGDDHDGTYCYRGEDGTCTRGTVYKDINLSDTNAQSLSALIFTGGFLGALLAYYPSEKFGRRLTLLGNTVLVFLGCLFSATGNEGLLYFGRFLSGISLGVISVVAPVLLAEICQDHYRGVITTVHEVFVALGLFSSVFFGAFFINYIDHGWQYIQAFGFLPSMILLAFYQDLPESPKWLLLHSTTEHHFDHLAETLRVSKFTRPSFAGHGTTTNPLIAGGNPPTVATGPDYRTSTAVDTTAAYSTITRLRTQDDRGNIDHEIRLTLAEIKEDSIQVPPWKELWAHPKPLIIGGGLFFFNAMSGINIVLFYAWNVFELEGFTESPVGACIFALSFFFMTITASRLIDSTGRRWLLLIGTFLMFCGLIVPGPVLISPSDPVFAAIISLMGLISYSAGFGLGLGTVIWPIMTEIVPTRLRITATTFFLCINWFFNIIVASTELSLVYAYGVPKDDEDDDAYYNNTKIGVGWLFVTYALFCLAGIIFIFIWIPETRNKTAEQIDKAAMPLIDGQMTKAELARQNLARESAVSRSKSYVVNS